MTLRSRISLAFVTIAVVLVAPAAFSLFTLWQLRDITQNLRTRDAMGALALGRLQTAFGEVQTWQRNYLPLAVTGAPEQQVATLERIQQQVEVFEAQLDSLTQAQYGRVVQPTRQRWQELIVALEAERELIDAGEFDQAEQYRESVVEPALQAVERTIVPIGQVINRVGEEEVQRAQALASSAVNATMMALVISLALAVLIAGWLARSLLRPIHELRQGMSLVAGGDFEPDLRLRPDRGDELGDLARSFQRMTYQLAELDRLKAEFVSVASHELKTPLSVIKGYVALLLEGIYGDVPPSQKKILASVAEQTDRLGRLIQQLLDISRFEAGGGRLDIRPFEVRQFLDELATSFEALAIQNQIRFSVHVDEHLPESLPGDPDRLNEVVGNLLSNAFKFTPRGGRIALRAAAANGGAVFEVEDTGVGIPHEHLPRIFEKFYQVENPAQPKSIGSGLGLAISREIVEAHGGTIAADSEPGQGTTFRVVLPMNPGPAAGLAQPETR